MAHSTTSTACHTIQFVIKILPVNRIYVLCTTDQGEKSNEKENGISS